MSIKSIIFMVLVIGMYMICVVFQINFLSILMQVFLVIVIYFYVDRFFAARTKKQQLESKLLVANKIIAENIDICIIVLGEDDEIIWANEETYEEFPVLLEKRDLEAINLHELDNESRLFYNHKVYDVSISDGIYTLRNITKSTRKLNNLRENTTNIGYLQIDNYKYLNDTLEAENFMKVSRDLKSDMTNLFETKNIYFSQIASDRFMLLIPSSALDKIIKDGFSELSAIYNKYLLEDIEVTYSLGVSNSYKNQRETGKRAFNALELAITRGGAQTVLHLDEERKFFGGGTTLKTNTRMKARIINNTLANILRRRDMVFIVTHKNPDADAIASMLLLARLIRARVDIDIRLVIDENIMPDLQYVLDMDDFIFSTVVDATKNNIVIVVDTQSSKIVSHPNLVNLVNDVIIFDHHQTPLDYIENPVFSWIEPGLSSTVEIITELLIISDVKIKDKELANLAITGVLIDTNNLKYRVDQATLDILSYHVSNGGNIEEARELDYLSADEFRLKHEIISNYEKKNNFAIATCYNIIEDKLLAICVDSLTEMQGVDAALIISILDDSIKVKMRSKREINSKLFLEEFGGGGHASQAAGIFPLSTKEKIIEKIWEEK